MNYASCKSNCGNKPILKRPKTGDALCKECFFWAFEEEIHHTITSANLFRRGDYVAIAASGGKDSTVLAHIMKLLNERKNYGLKLVLLSIDEGITGYRDDSLETVKRNETQYGIPLKILSYEELYGWTMDRIVEQIGLKNNCTFCGVFRRQALDRGAALLKVDKMVTGHNADDIAETIIMNVLRGDVARLQRCTAINTSSDAAQTIPRSKPFKYTYEKEIVMYAYFKQLDYFSTECIYSPNAYRGHARAYIKDLEKIRPSCIIDIIHSGESLSIREGVNLPVQSTCVRCGYVSSQPLCKACVLLEGLNKGKPRLGIGKTSKINLALQENRDSSSDEKENHDSSSDGKENRDSSSDEKENRDSSSDGKENREGPANLDLKDKSNFANLKEKGYKPAVFNENNKIVDVEDLKLNERQLSVNNIEVEAGENLKINKKPGNIKTCSNEEVLNRESTLKIKEKEISSGGCESCSCNNKRVNKTQDMEELFTYLSLSKDSESCKSLNKNS